MPFVLLLLSALLTAPSNAAQTHHFCVSGPPAAHFLAQVRALAIEADSAGRRHAQGLATLAPDQVRIVYDDSTCAAVSRVLGGFIRSGSFPPQTLKPPFPVAVVRAGSKYVVHDAATAGKVDYGDSYITLDTFQPRPKPPYLLAGQCWTYCCQFGRWHLLTAVALREKPNVSARLVGSLPTGIDVNADTGVILVDSIGLVIVRSPTWDSFLNDTLMPPDTLLPLVGWKPEDSDTPEYYAWWRGLIIHVDQFWDPAGHSGAQILAQPHATWWVRMSAVRGNRRLHGWAEMADTVRVEGNNGCS